MDTLRSSIPVPEPLLLSVVVSCQGGTNEMWDDICGQGKNQALLKGRGSRNATNNVD